jgi:2,3-dihydroxybenzoate-AMP ligase
MPRKPVHASRAGTVPWPREFAQHYVEQGYWRERPFGAELYASADRYPVKVALVDGLVRLTYAQLMSRADGAALRLRSLGLEPDDRVVVQLPNCWEFVVLTLACLRAGIVPVMALPGHRHHELSYLAEHSEARAIAVADVVRDFDHQAMAHGVAAGSDTVEQVLVTGNAAAGSVDVRALLEPAEDPVAARASLDASAPDPYDVAVFLLSGGTTGLPKLIARTHNDYVYNARRSGEVCGVDADTVYLGVLPLGHNFPLACPGILGTFLAGGTVVIASSPEPGKVFDLIDRERVTVTAAVPAVAQRWLEYRGEHDGHDLSSLRLLQVGGARLADEVARRVRPVLGGALQQVFGMAEGLLNYTRLDDPDDISCATQGRPMCPDDEVCVVDESGSHVATGEPGVLLTRGPYTPRGYYRAPEHNARAFTSDGWYRTGDIVRLRPDGNLVVEGRDKDMINRGGEKISAEEVENFAYQVPGVSLAAAVAMPDPDLGERVCLYVVAHAGCTVTLDDVHEVMNVAGTARFKLPERLVLVTELATTKVGKIDKKALRADISARLESERSPIAGGVT